MVNIKRIFSFVLILGMGVFLLSRSALAVTVPNPLPGVTSFCVLLTNIASGVGMFVATLGTIMIIISGIMFLLSAGSAEKMTKAKTALVYAVIGIVVGISASTIVAIVKEVLNASGVQCR